jgi:hypothetical protein
LLIPLSVDLRWNPALTRVRAFASPSNKELSKMRNILPAGVVAFLLGMGILEAQQPVPVRTEPQPAATVATYRAKQILGSKISLQSNTAVGTVDDIVFDAAGNLEYLIVANEGKLITVPWDAAKFDLKNHSATLNVTPDVYRTIPTYTTTTYPDYWAPTYRTQTYRYFGMTPRELRRIERRAP